MGKFRLATMVAASVVLLTLALTTDSFWWFRELGWQTFAEFSAAKPTVTVACLWAALHGLLSAATGTVLCLAVSPYETRGLYIYSLTVAFVMAALVLSIGDITSGWWWWVEGGRYIPLAYNAFLQAFLFGYLTVLVCIPSPVIKKPG